MADSETPGNEPAQAATRILIARRGCTAEEASTLLTHAAREHNMSITAFAQCLIADQENR